MQSGFGTAGWQGGCPFRPGSNCSANAWGSGGGPLAQALIDRAKNDPDVVALTLNEAWTCATPARIRSLLGWAAVASGSGNGEAGGVSIVARYGFAGASEVKALPKCSSTAEQRYVVRAPVYLDAGKTNVAQVYATHWTGCSAEADATRQFMQQQPYKPRSLTGDLNLKDPASDPIQELKNGNQYGSPRGSLYKRIDYTFAKTLTPLGMRRFNHSGTPGVCKESDHAGTVVEYAR